MTVWNGMSFALPPSTISTLAVIIDQQVDRKAYVAYTMRVAYSVKCLHELMSQSWPPVAYGS